MLSGQQVIWNFFWMAFNAWAMANFAIPGTLQLLGVITGSQALKDLAGAVTNSTVVIAIAVVLQILFALLHISGIKSYFVYMKITFAFCVLSVTVAILYLMFGGKQLPGKLGCFHGRHSGLSYQQVIATAVAEGFNPAAPFSLAQPWL